MIDDSEKIVSAAPQAAPAPVFLLESQPAPEVTTSDVAEVIQVYETPMIRDAIERLRALAGKPRNAKTPNPDPSSNAHKRTMEQQEEDYLLILPLVSRRATGKSVADWLASFRPYRLSPQRVWRDMKVVKQRLIEQGKIAMEERRAIELEHIRQQEDLAYAAWEASKEDATTVTKITDPNNPANTKVVVRKEERCGDPKWLRILIELRNQRMVLEGTAAPIKAQVEVTTEENPRLALPALREAYRKRLLAKEAHANVIPMEPPKTA